MFARPHNDVQVARWSAHRPGIAPSRQTNPLPVARTRLDAHTYVFAAFHTSFAVANRAYGAVFSRPTAARARHVELHVPALLCNLAFTLALRTLAGTLEESAAMAGRATLQVRHTQLQLGALDGLPEANIHLVFEVAARCWPRCSFGSATAAKHR